MRIERVNRGQQVGFYRKDFLNFAIVRNSIALAVRTGSRDQLTFVRYGVTIAIHRDRMIGHGKDDTLFAKIDGFVSFRDRGRKGKFVSVLPEA